MSGAQKWRFYVQKLPLLARNLLHLEGRTGLIPWFSPLMGCRVFCWIAIIKRMLYTWAGPGGGGGTPIHYPYGMCRPTGSWFWSSWFRTGYPFQRRFLERGIIFRTHECSSFVSSHLKLFKDRLLLKIWFNALTSKLLYSLHLRTEYKKLAYF